MAQPMRPRFRRRIEIAPDDAFRRLREAVADEACPFRARFAENHGHAELRVAIPHRHFWSPTLSLEIRSGDDGATTVHGLFGPHPAVWTFFMFVHFAAVTGAMIGLSLAWSQWSLDESAWGLWSLPAAAIASGAAYGASLFGQRLARDEMTSMLALLDRIAPECVRPSSGGAGGPVPPGAGCGMIAPGGATHDRTERDAGQDRGRDRGPGAPHPDRADRRPP